MISQIYFVKIVENCKSEEAVLCTGRFLLRMERMSKRKKSQVNHIAFSEKRIPNKLNSYIHPAKSCTISTNR